MKPTIPDTGSVIGLDGENAIVRMKSERSCRKCGAAAIGLCKAGLLQVLTVRNPMNAQVGDTVRIGLVKEVQYTGYVLAYAVPSAALLAGSAAGHFLGSFVGFPPLDIILGFSSLIVVSSLSLSRLKRLDSTSSIEIMDVLADPLVPGSFSSKAGTCSDRTISPC